MHAHTHTCVPAPPRRPRALLPCDCLQVQDGASEVFGPVLERSAKAERIRSVQALLTRFGGVFAAPQRVRALGAARDYEQVGTCVWGGAPVLAHAQAGSRAGRQASGADGLLF